MGKKSETNIKVVFGEYTSGTSMVKSCPDQGHQTEPVDRYYITIMDQLEIAYTLLENEPTNTDSAIKLKPSSPQVESECSLPAAIECGLCHSQ